MQRESTASAIKCRHPQCPVDVFMLLYLRTGKKAPIEVALSDKGNIHVDLQQGTYIILTGEELEKARARGVPLHLSHFATCEFAKQFAKGAR